MMDPMGKMVGMYAKTVKHKKMPALASVRSSIIMNYGDWIRAIILTNHCHDFNPKYQHAYIKLEGTKALSSVFSVHIIRDGVIGYDLATKHGCLTKNINDQLEIVQEKKYFLTG